MTDHYWAVTIAVNCSTTALPLRSTGLVGVYWYSFGFFPLPMLTWTVWTGVYRQRTNYPVLPTGPEPGFTYFAQEVNTYILLFPLKGTFLVVNSALHNLNSPEIFGSYRQNRRTFPVRLEKQKQNSFFFFFLCLGKENEFIEDNILSFPKIGIKKFRIVSREK